VILFNGEKFTFSERKNKKVKVDLEFLKQITKEKINRKQEWKKDTRIVNEFDNIFLIVKTWIKNNISYTKSSIASMIISLYRWIKAEEDNKRRFDKDINERPKPLIYQPREIVYIDLGGNNFGVEASYEHPAVVVHNGYYFLLVIPGSTGRFGKSDYILNANEKENFEHSTGLQIDQIRVIDKSRVIRRTNKKVSVELMGDINRKILDKYLYPVSKELSSVRRENEMLKSQNEKLKDELNQLKNETISIAK